MKFRLISSLIHLSLTFFSLSALALGQAYDSPTVDWAKNLNTGSAKAVELSDQSFCAVSGQNYFFIVSKSGSLSSSKAVPGRGAVYLTGISSDAGATFAVGYTNETSGATSRPYDPYIVRINNDNTIQEHFFNSPGDQSIYSFVRDGNDFYVVGTVQYSGDATYRGYIAKINIDSGVIWERTISSRLAYISSELDQVIAIGNGHFLAIGSSDAAQDIHGNISSTCRLISFDSLGNTTSKSIPNIGGLLSITGAATSADNYYISGYKDFIGSTKGFLAKFTLDLNLVWLKPTQDSPQTISSAVNSMMLDQSYLLLGTYERGSLGSMFVSKYNSDGILIWKVNLGATSFNGINFSPWGFIARTTDNRIISSDRTYFAKLDSDGIPYIPPIVIPSPPPTPLPGKKNLVVTTHGWEPPLISSTGGDKWYVGMANDIRSHINASLDSSSWDVLPYDWYDNANVWPIYVTSNAREEGVALGKSLATLGYQHVHLIAHSAGAWLIDAAAKELEKATSPPSIQLTFLDPFVPDLSRDQLADGNCDWSDEYISPDIMTNVFTAVPLIHSYVVGLGNLDPSHGYPYEWYDNTVKDTGYGQGVGFIRSMEGGGLAEWNRNSSDFPAGSGETVLDRNLIGAINVGENILSKSSSGLISLLQNGMTISLPPIAGLTLKGDSVTTRSAWSEFNLNFPPSTNYMNFDYQFKRPVNSQVSFYLNGQFILSSNERIRGLDPIHSGDIYVGDKLKDKNFFGIRYDTFSSDNASASSVFVSLVSYGNVSNAKNGVRNWRLY